MDDLVAWLRAQIDDDERVARKVLSLESDDFEYEYTWSRWSRHKQSGGSGSMSLAGAPTPRERLAEVDAKRRILDEYEQAKTYYDQHREAPAGEAYGLLTAIKLLALPFAGREGYRAEWRP